MEKSNFKMSYKGLANFVKGQIVNNILGFVGRIRVCHMFFALCPPLHALTPCFEHSL